MLINLDYNLEDVSSTFVVLPAEGYICRIFKADLTETKDTKKPMLDFTWEVIDGEHAGHKIFPPDHVVLSVDWKVKQYCDLAGIESGSQFNSEDFLGVEALVNVSVGEYNKKPKNEIDSIEAIL